MRQSANKRQVEQARQDRAARKQQRREDRSATPAEEVAPVADNSSTLDALKRLHESFEAGTIDFEEFESTKHQLIAQLGVV